jgi:hypothetical protein
MSRLAKTSDGHGGWLPVFFFDGMEFKSHNPPLLASNLGPPGSHFFTRDEKFFVGKKKVRKRPVVPRSIRKIALQPSSNFDAC